MLTEKRSLSTKPDVSKMLVGEINALLARKVRSVSSVRGPTKQSFAAWPMPPVQMSWTCGHCNSSCVTGMALVMTVTWVKSVRRRSSRARACTVELASRRMVSPDWMS